MIEDMQQYIKEIRQMVSGRLDMTRNLEDEEIRDTIAELVAEESRKQYMTLTEKREVIEGVFNSMRGLDVLQPLVDDPTVTEIMINGPHHVFIEQSGRLFRKDVSFGTNEKLENVILNIVSRVNRTVNEANPIVDARLLDGSRVNVVLPPIALDGPTVTIRKFPEDPMTVQKLIAYGSITPEVAELLERMVKAKYNIFISGGTGSGKTTFLNALSNFIPRDERVITIEDSAELQIKGVDNLVRLETRNANMEGKGEVTIRDLIRSSLRMRPEGIKIKKGKLKRKKKRTPIPHTFLQHILGNLIPLIRCEVVKIIEEADDLLSLFHSVLHVEGILPIHGICTQHPFSE